MMGKSSYTYLYDETGEFQWRTFRGPQGPRALGASKGKFISRKINTNNNKGRLIVLNATELRFFLLFSNSTKRSLIKYLRGGPH